jgi:hypothetical protein
MPAETREPEIIASDQVLHRGTVGRVDSPTDIMRVKAALVITVIALVIGVGTLMVSAANDNNQLQAWATGLISAIAGAAISYGFNSQRS